MKSRIWIVIVALTFAISAYLMSLNFHAIDDHHVFRSAQLAPFELKNLMRLYGIKTVINLRGESPDAPWFKNEKSVVAALGASLVSINMSSRTLPDREAEIKLIETLKSAPKPILLHCLSGSDRTGEASAIYKMVVQRESKEEALKMLSPRYLHFDFSRPSKRYFIEMFQGEDWVKNKYNPCSGEYRFYDPKNPDCVR